MNKQIAGKRWKVDLNSRQEASLLLSAVNLPGGVQVGLRGRPLKPLAAALTETNAPSVNGSAALLCALDLWQRRRTAEDELNMRSVFREGDLISVSA
jgi:exosome complex component RRP4